MRLKEQHKCLICHSLHETGDYVTGTDDPVTSWIQCDNCVEELDKGQVAMIEAIPDEEERLEGNIAPSTGNHQFISKEMFEEVYKMEIPDEAMGMLFVDKSVYGELQNIRQMAIN